MGPKTYVLPRAFRPVGGQGQPYGDDVVEMARSLVLTTDLTFKEIAARVGVSHMTIGRWAKSGRWRPFGRLSRVPRPVRNWAEMEGAYLRPDPWGRLVEAERLLDLLERGSRTGLDEIARVLDLLLGARRDHARPPRRRQNRGGVLARARQTDHAREAEADSGPPPSPRFITLL